MAKITFNLDQDAMTWGDFEDMESKSPTKIRQVLQKYATIEGRETPTQVGEALRKMTLREIGEVIDAFRDAIQTVTNPVDATGKNSKSGSPSISQPA